MASLFRMLLGVCLAGLLGLLGATARAADHSSHAGPVITVEVARGEQQLPLDKVDRLRRGDRVLVQVERGGVVRGPWMLLLAVATPAGDQVATQRFDLTQEEVLPSIDISDDDQLPIIVMAPQVKTFFGLGTSFGQSADLIEAAIVADPQRFVELQQIDQLDRAIATLTSGLDAMVAKLRPEQTVEATRTLAAKFGAKTIDADCLKGGVVDTRCVATSIVSSRDLRIPSLVELGALAQPFATHALSADTLANVRLVAATSSFLANKYRDQYDFAPSSAQKEPGSERLRLFTRGQFKGGDIKTAYVYVPSWYAGAPPQLSIASQPMACLAAGELKLNVAGQLPMRNYWHSWFLSLSEPGRPEPVMSLDALRFSPETGTLQIDPKPDAQALAQHGFALQASLSGRYAFEPLRLADFTLALPSNADLRPQLTGLETLVADDQASLGFADEAVRACIDRVTLSTDQRTRVASRVGDQWQLDLQDLPAGEAQLEVTQLGGQRQTLTLRLAPPRARLARLEHFDLEPVLHASGDKLERIASIELGPDRCVPDDAAPIESSPTQRRFICPAGYAEQARVPKQATIHYQGQEPAPDTQRLTLTGARPLVAVGSGRKALLSVLSPRAVQWGFDLDDVLMTQDSGLAVYLKARAGYQVKRGSYTLQLKFADDPVTAQKPLSVFLMADPTHDELRTRRPVDFSQVQLPHVVNPVWYRVLHQPSGLASDWQRLNKAVISVPTFGSVRCDEAAARWLIPGSQLELIDWASADLTLAPTQAAASGARFAELTRCDDGLCLAIQALGEGGRLRIKLHWIEDRVFDVRLPNPPTCPRPTPASNETRPVD